MNVRTTTEGAVSLLLVPTYLTVSTVPAILDTPVMDLLVVRYFVISLYLFIKLPILFVRHTRHAPTTRPITCYNPCQMRLLVQLCSKWQDFVWHGAPRLPVNSSQGHLVTRSTRHRSTRHRHVSSHSQLVTSEHITKPPVPVVICTPSGDIQIQCSTRTS